MKSVSNKDFPIVLMQYLQAVLVLGDGCTQTQIFKHTLLNKQTVNSSVKKLHQDGLIDFQPGSGREQKIYLTNKGEQIITERILPPFSKSIF